MSDKEDKELRVEILVTALETWIEAIIDEKAGVERTARDEFRQWVSDRLVEIL